MFTSLILLTACSPEPASLVEGPQDGFGDEQSVRIVSPEQGQVTDTSVLFRLSLGDQVNAVQLFDSDMEPLSERIAVARGDLRTELEPGRWTVTVQGFSAQGDRLDSDQVSFRVVDQESEDPWVSFTTPLDGAAVANPVTFVLDASSEISVVALSVDEWPLGEVEPGEVFSYRFNGTDQPRDVLAQAYDASGLLVASEAITITPLSGSDGGPTVFSERVAQLVESYPQDGTFSYYWPKGGSWSGSTRDILYQDELVATDGGYSACYCSGITWEWYLMAWQSLATEGGLDADDLNGVDDSDIWQMRRDWYVRELDGDGPGIALQDRGLGTPVGDWDQVVRGDFVQLWRTSGSGHTAIFWDWELDSDGDRIGFQYASCQGASDGLGLNSEYFGTHSGAIDPALVYFSRAWVPADWL